MVFSVAAASANDQSKTTGKHVIFINSFRRSKTVDGLIGYDR